MACGGKLLILLFELSMLKNIEYCIQWNAWQYCWSLSYVSFLPFLYICICNWLAYYNNISIGTLCSICSLVSNVKYNQTIPFRKIFITETAFCDNDKLNRSVFSLTVWNARYLQILKIQIFAWFWRMLIYSSILCVPNVKSHFWGLDIMKRKA